MSFKKFFMFGASILAFVISLSVSALCIGTVKVSENILAANAEQHVQLVTTYFGILTPFIVVLSVITGVVSFVGIVIYAVGFFNAGGC